VEYETGWSADRMRKNAAWRWVGWKQGPATLKGAYETEFLVL